MIELKISQGAKPGHGGILPAKKNTEEIAKIRHVKPHTDVDSPPSHSAFKDPEGLLKLIYQMRELSGGKPVGFKLCIGRKEEFIDICEAMVRTGLRPDFITIDGGEGGTGAAPVEFSNSLGMPLLDGLAFAVDTLKGYDLKKDIKVIASGKIMSSFHIARALAIGADLCNSARAMMLAIGCIQALQCHLNTCPTGIATQNKQLMKGLDVENKAMRTYQFRSELKKDIKVIASGKIMSSFHIARALAIGADLCNSARAMMLAIGCIQALQCHLNTCPTGIATQNKQLMKGLDVENKAMRTYQFHKNTMKSFGELISAAGLVHHSEIDRTYINLRVDVHSVVRYDELYPVVETGSYLNKVRDHSLT